MLITLLQFPPLAMKEATIFHCVVGLALICLLSGAALSRPVDPTDIVKSGPYYIGNCGSKKPDGGDAKTLGSAIEMTRMTLDHTVKELTLLATSYGFDNFFKFRSAIEPVRRLYQNMLDGNNVLYHFPEVGSGPVGFICIYPDDPYSSTTHEKICKPSPDGSITYFSSYGGGKHIFICPAFFDVAIAQTPPPAYCPRVVGHVMYPNDAQLTNTRLGLIALMFATIYLGAQALEDQINVQDAINLDPRASMRNPPSYALYLSCKCPAAHSV